MGLWSAVRERYGVRTPLAELRAKAEGTELRRTLGAWDLTALGVGAMVGVGVFTVTGLVAADYAGPGVALSFVVAALVSVLVALAYAELATLMPLGGSAYTYAFASMGELVGWLVAWALIASYGVGNAAIASGFSDNLSGLSEAFGMALPQTWTATPGAGGLVDVPAALVVGLVTILLLRPVKESASWNSALVVMKIGTLLLFIVLGATAIDTANYTSFAPKGVEGIVAGAGLAFFAFLGFDAVSTAAEETRNPGRNVPLGILASLAIVVVLFVAAALVLTGMAPSELLRSGEPLAFALRYADLGWAAVILNVGGLLATLSVLLVFQLATTRIVLAIARDGLLPSWLAAVSAKHATPNRTTLILGAIVAVSAAALPLDFLIMLTNEATLFFFAIVCLAVVVLRRTEPDAPRAFRCPGSPWVPLAGVGACLYLMATFGPLIHYGFAAWMGVGLVLYAVYGIRASALRAARAKRGAETAPVAPAPPVEP
ncbi:MAG TPA: amino acid permease [Candidatus Thermoplasmatota archaeon]|nr:amino acid permease [Candidatus Thermoplasmatota archaeon]